jgi:hypothetical protein
LKKDKEVSRLHHKRNYVGMMQWFRKIEWEVIMSKCSLEMWCEFCEKIQQAVDKYVPVAKGKSR